MEMRGHSGPLPDPETLNAYPTEAQKIILQMAQDEQKHRHQKEQDLQREESRRRLSGVAVIFGVLAVTALGYGLGKEAGPTTLATGTIVALATIFVLRQRPQIETTKDKAIEPKEPTKEPPKKEIE
jgi:uncharacterized membrane protein